LRGCLRGTLGPPLQRQNRCRGNDLSAQAHYHRDARRPLLPPSMYELSTASVRFGLPVGALQKTALGPVTYDAASASDAGIACRLARSGADLRMVQPASADAQVRHVLCPPECGEVDGVRRNLPDRRTSNGERDALIAEARTRLAAKRTSTTKDLWPLRGRWHLGVLPFGGAVRTDRTAHEPAARVDAMLTWRVLELLPDVV